MNQEQHTLREVIQQRFEELDDHISALHVVSSGTDIPSFLSAYNDLKLTYEREILTESIKELEDRVIIVESYQSLQRLVMRQVVTVLFTALLIVIGYILGWYT